MFQLNLFLTQNKILTNHKLDFEIALDASGCELCFHTLNLISILSTLLNLYFRCDISHFNASLIDFS